MNIGLNAEVMLCYVMSCHVAVAVQGPVPTKTPSLLRGRGLSDLQALALNNEFF